MTFPSPISPAHAGPVHNPVPDRSADILGRLREVFAQKGFDGASMQDLARAAGMSVGNFYRYFPSKAAIVEGMVALDIAEIEQKFADIRTADDLMGAVRGKIAGEVCTRHKDKGQLWAEIGAAAHRKTEVAAICGDMEERICANMLGVFARVSGLTPEACHQRFGAHARFVVMMVKAAATRQNDALDPDLNVLILQSINRVLDDVTDAASEKS